MDLILSFLLVAMDEYTLVFANDAFYWELLAVFYSTIFL